MSMIHTMVANTIENLPEDDRDIIVNLAIGRRCWTGYDWDRVTELRTRYADEIVYMRGYAQSQEGDAGAFLNEIHRRKLGAGERQA